MTVLSLSTVTRKGKSYPIDARTNGNYLYGMMHEAHGLRTNGAFVVVFVVEGIFSKSARRCQLGRKFERRCPLFAS